MNHQKLICIILGFFLHFALLAQTVGSRSIIKMSPAEFEILMETILEAKQKKARKARMSATSYYSDGSSANGVVEALQEQNLKQRLGDIEKLLIQIREKQQAIPPANSTNSTTTPALNKLDLLELKEALLSELKEIKKEIENLPDLMPQTNLSVNPSSPIAPNPPVVIRPSPTPDSTNVPDNQQQQMLFQLLVSNLDAMNQRLSDLQKKANTTAQQDDLLLVQKKLATLTLGVSQSPDLDDNQKIDLAKKLDAIRQLITANNPTLNNTKETITLNETLPTDEEYAALKKRIVGQEKTVLLFDNNASQLSPNAINQLSNIVALLQTYKRLDVIITGFASAKGSPIYNEAISQNRTESVKKYLMSQGFHATRIFTEYHGIDYNVKTPNEARRVEVVLLIRN